MSDYQETITVCDRRFHLHDQDESHIWDYCYESEPVAVVNSIPVIIKLYVGTRSNSKTDLAWSARLYVGPHCIFTDALEYYEPEETVQKCLNQLTSEDTLQLMNVYTTRKNEREES